MSKQILSKEFQRMQRLAGINEIKVNTPSSIYGVTTDGEHLDFKLDENLELLVYDEYLQSLIIKDKRIKTLNCFSNNLTSLNVSKLTNLEELYCGGNKLTSLNVKGLTKLEWLDCSDNKLTSLDVNGLTKLKVLNCSSNNLTSLDVSGLTDLERLYCNYNYLTSLDVKGCTNLKELYCVENELMSLDVSGLTKLKDLYCDKNVKIIKDNIDEIKVNKPNLKNVLLNLIKKNEDEVADELGFYYLSEIKFDDLGDVGAIGVSLDEEDDYETETVLAFRFPEDVDDEFKGEEGDKPRSIEIAGKKIMYITHNI